MYNKKAILVTDLKTGKDYNVEIHAGHFLMLMFQEGQFSNVAKNPDDYLFRIEYDCPFIFPLKNQTSSFLYKSKTFTYSHWIEVRGNHRFSTLDVYQRNEFSTFLIEGELCDLGINVSGSNINEGAPGVASECLKILDFLNDKINKISKNPINLEINKILSIKITLGSKGNPPYEVATLTIPYNREIDLRSLGEKMEFINPNELHDYLNEKTEIKQYFVNNIERYEKDSSFIDAIFRLTHDFAFYISERPEVIAKLREELIRDLFLIPIKTYEFLAEAEAYIYDGKLDYRIINPYNKYEIISGEFKIWKGIDSFNECYMQISEKHSTGNETEVYLVMINKNNIDITMLYNLMIKELKRKDSYEKTINENISLSKAQFFSRHTIKIKSHSVPIVIGVINAYYKKV